MIAISFAPYSEETIRSTRQCRERGCKIVAITDSLMSPIAQSAHAPLVVHESETFGFRSLTNTICLAQSLFIALAYHLELNYEPTSMPGVQV